MNLFWFCFFQNLASNPAIDAKICLSPKMRPVRSVQAVRNELLWWYVPTRTGRTLCRLSQFGSELKQISFRQIFHTWTCRQWCIYSYERGQLSVLSRYFSARTSDTLKGPSIYASASGSFPAPLVYAFGCFRQRLNTRSRSARSTLSLLPIGRPRGVCPPTPTISPSTQPPLLAKKKKKKEKRAQVLERKKTKRE